MEQTTLALAISTSTNSIDSAGLEDAAMCEPSIASSRQAQHVPTSDHVVQDTTSKGKMFVIQASGKKRRMTIAKTMEELLNKGSAKFGETYTTIYMDKTGAEIDEEEVFQNLQDGEILTLCAENEDMSVLQRGLIPSVEDASNETIPPTTAPAEVQSVTSEWQPWPKNFKPTIKLDYNIECQLKSENLLDEYGRSNLLTVLYTEATKYTMYPTHAQYLDMVAYILTMWPHLSREDNLSMDTVKGLWLKRIRSKFQNNRKRKESTLEIVKEAKSKFGMKKKKHDSDEKQSSDDRATMFGMNNYNPEKPASEDEVSTTRHIKAMQNAFKSRKPDFTKINNLMDLTLYARRQDVLKGMSVKDILAKYPWLQKTAEAIFIEFQRISHIQIEKNFKVFLGKYGNAIVQMVAKKAESDDLIKYLLSQKGSVDEKYAAASAAILGIVHLLKEDVSILVGAKVPEPDIAPVFIQCSYQPDRFLDCTKFPVYVDGIVISECGDFVEAFEACICCYYIFNLSYKGLAKSFTMMEKIVLNTCVDVPQSKRGMTKEEKSVITLISTLNVSVDHSGKKSKKVKKVGGATK